MLSSEIVEAFRKRDQPLGGNETRTAWNRLWTAKERGVLVNYPRYGYWLADEPPPDFSKLAVPKKAKTAPGGPLRNSWKGRKIGRVKLLSDAQVKLAEKWILEGKTFKEVAHELGGIAVGTLVQQYFPGGRRALRLKHAESLSAKPKLPSQHAGKKKR